ncbi:MAG: MFS transporter TsgA [Buchnera aphidicola (Periphyllus lyropictus)]|uniref:MFS transporter TsgA n=1 Tax=Buchnera aphidicola TaxID=9 RepID=UPI001EC422B9|nr:MFS transporter TsgA [Buchnera aphidicola]NIH16464.1 MFS transporter TsgA [Buchnera aphidicola (Periphyllus lyropictus)]USS94749.1 MFS transporter TsgA [Buchnera aphidicola (Periphyllus lyropictus)]
MKNKNKKLLTYISFLSYAFMGALISVTGLVIQNISHQFKIPITNASNIFNFLNIGILISIFFNSWLIKIFSLKKQIFFGFILMILATTTSIILKNINMFCFSIFLFGLISGTTLSIGTFLITNLYKKKERIKKMLLTDSFFSISGFVFPTINVFFITYKIQWNYIYILISLIYFIIFLISNQIKYPKILKKEKKKKNYDNKYLDINVILLYFSALIYILGQLGFISWIPENSIKNMNITIEKSSTIISSFWINYMIGMWFFSYIIKFFNLKKIILFLSSISTIIMFLFIQNKNYYLSLFLISLLGFFSSSIYSMIITLSSLQTKKPSQKIINFTLFSGTIGTMLNFLITSPIVRLKGVKYSLFFSNILYLIVFFIFLILFYKKKIINKLHKK